MGKQHSKHILHCVNNSENVPEESGLDEEDISNSSCLKNYLGEADYECLTTLTGFSRAQINEFLKEFIKNNPNELLDQNEFKNLYCQLKGWKENESDMDEKLSYADESCKFIFDFFDVNQDHQVSFKEFLIGFSITSIKMEPFTSDRDLKKVLEYLYSIYDANSDGNLTEIEIEKILGGWCKIIGCENDSKKLISDCLEKLDKNKDGNINKDDFLECLIVNKDIRDVMCLKH